MNTPSPQDQELARSSYQRLTNYLQSDLVQEPKIQYGNPDETITIPAQALTLLAEILEHMSQGNTVTLHSTNEQLSTQAAANYLNCSRPHLVKLLESGKIPMTKVGKHRRVQLRHLIEWKEQSKREQKEALTKMMRYDEELGLY